MSFATFRTCLMMCVLTCGVSNVGAMQESSRNSLVRIIPGSEPFSKAFIEGHHKVFELMVYETAELPAHSREWMRPWYVDFAQDKFASIFPPQRIEQLTVEEEQIIICATRKRMHDHETLASKVVDDIIDWCIRKQQDQIKRARRGSFSDTDDF
jgi:hypothetical protein